MSQKIIQLCLLILSFTLISSKSAAAVVQCAKNQLGKSYVYGAAGPNTFDCSGLAYYCFDKAIPRTSSAQASSGSAGNGSAGDLVFFDTAGKGSVTHTGICIGSGQMIHAPKTGDVVKAVTFSGNTYWQPKLKGYRRYWS